MLHVCSTLDNIENASVLISKHSDGATEGCHGDEGIKVPTSGQGTLSYGMVLYHSREVSLLCFRLHCFLALQCPFFSLISKSNLTFHMCSFPS